MWAANSTEFFRVSASDNHLLKSGNFACPIQSLSVAHNISDCLIIDGIAMSEKTIEVTLSQVENYQFRVRFSGGMPDLQTDEPAPLGQNSGPTPVQLLCAAVGNCLTDSLLFAFRKFKQNPDPLSAMITAKVGRNAQGRMRVLSIHADLTLGVAADQLEHLDRVLNQFEEFCTVTQSVGQGIDIQLSVVDANGATLKGLRK